MCTPMLQRFIDLASEKQWKLEVMRDGSVEIDGIEPKVIGDAAYERCVAIHELRPGEQGLENFFFSLVDEVV